MPESYPVVSSVAKRAHAIRSVPPVAAPPGPSAVQPGEVSRPSGPGKFELVRADGGGFLIRILDGTGAVPALSGSYQDIAAAVRGVEVVRECAATAHISDQTAQAPPLP